MSIKLVITRFRLLFEKQPQIDFAYIDCHWLSAAEVLIVQVIPSGLSLPVSNSIKWKRPIKVLYRMLQKTMNYQCRKFYCPNYTVRRHHTRFPIPVWETATKKTVTIGYRFPWIIRCRSSTGPSNAVWLVYHSIANTWIGNGYKSPLPYVK
jgi:hypothetical protein